MAINHSHQHVLHNGRSRRVRSLPFGVFLGSLAWATLAGPAWATDLTSPLADAGSSESSSNATWQVEISYAVEDAIVTPQE